MSAVAMEKGTKVIGAVGAGEEMAREVVRRRIAGGEGCKFEGDGVEFMRQEFDPASS